MINHFEDMPLSRVIAYHIDRLCTKMRQEKARGGKGLSARTVRYVHTLLAAGLNRAVDLSLIAHNPALKVKPPPSKKRKRVDPPQPVL